MDNSTPTIPRYVLPLIVFAQFAGVSVWFAGNAVVDDFREGLGLPQGVLGNITGAVQMGFIAGTLAFAFFLIADRFAPTRVFLICSLLGGLMNAGMLLPSLEYESLLLLRFFTGFCLAGIYPVGMKIAADWFDSNLGKAMGYLVGALVLGTAFPHLSRYLFANLPWQLVVLSSTILAMTGGLILFFGLGDGPYRKKSAALNPLALREAFRNVSVRGAALGYFGHMWELYAFWAFVPLFLPMYRGWSEFSPDISLLSFVIIASGMLGCVAGGYLSLKRGSKWVAAGMMWISGSCCLLSPWALTWPPVLFVLFMLVWGFAVVGDSPQFSTLMARHANPAYKGSVLTIATATGFALTVVSIAWLGWLSATEVSPFLFYILFPGPFIGLLGLRQARD